MKVICHTNLDLHNEVWPTELPVVPSVGHKIISATKHKDFQLPLEVVEISWKLLRASLKPAYHGGDPFPHNGEEWIPHIELHMTSWQRRIIPRDNYNGKISDGSITAFYQWYAPLVGKSVSAFI